MRHQNFFKKKGCRRVVIGPQGGPVPQARRTGPAGGRPGPRKRKNPALQAGVTPARARFFVGFFFFFKFFFNILFYLFYFFSVSFFSFNFKFIWF